MRTGTARPFDALSPDPVLSRLREGLGPVMRQKDVKKNSNMFELQPCFHNRAVIPVQRRGPVRGVVDGAQGGCDRATRRRVVVPNAGASDRAPLGGVLSMKGCSSNRIKGARATNAH
jgi:hypothetical protein